MSNIYDRIKLARLSKKLSQVDVAESLGLSSNAYSRLERGFVQLNIERLEQLAGIFDISLKELLFPEDSGEQAQNEKIEVLQKHLAELEKEIVYLKEIRTALQDNLSFYKSTLSNYQSLEQDMVNNRQDTYGLLNGILQSLYLMLQQTNAKGNIEVPQIEEPIEIDQLKEHLQQLLDLLEK